MRKISAFYLIYATEQFGFSIAWSETRKTDFFGFMPVHQPITKVQPHLFILAIKGQFF